jgi:DNA-binding MarR family transcriptional regulator
MALAQTFLRIVNKVIENQKRSRRYGIAEKLYPAEIHTLMAIGNSENVHVSELARLQGVTRGAVSQMIERLNKKGLIEKHVDPANATRVLLNLTDKGKMAFDAHERFHQETDAPLFDYIERLSEKEYAFAQKFLGKLEDMVDRMR